MASIFQTVASNQTMPGNRAYIRTLNHHWKKKKTLIKFLKHPLLLTTYRRIYRKLRASVWQGYLEQNQIRSSWFFQEYQTLVCSQVDLNRQWAEFCHLFILARIYEISARWLARLTRRNLFPLSNQVGLFIKQEREKKILTRSPASSYGILKWLQSK